MPVGNYTQKLADLHVHLEGTVTPATLAELARKNRVDLGAPTEFAPGIDIPAPPRHLLSAPFNGDFREFILLYAKIASCLRDADDLLFVGQSYLEKAAAEGVIAADIYLSPSTLFRLGLNQEEIRRGLLSIQELASRRYDFRIRWIFDFVRGVKLDGMETVNAATELRDRGVNVVYIGLGGMEAGNPAKPFKEAFTTARERGFRILAHAGETAGAESMWETIEAAAPERIGHGISCLSDPKLVQYLIDNDIVLEVSPWSNVLLRVCEAKSHPLPALYEAGLKIVLCSDDPGIFGRSLLSNYEFAAKRGVNYDFLEKSTQLALSL